MQYIEVRQWFNNSENSVAVGDTVVGNAYSDYRENPITDGTSVSFEVQAIEFIDGIGNIATGTDDISYWLN